jgi:hypothetical protein
VLNEYDDECRIVISLGVLSKVPSERWKKFLDSECSFTTTIGIDIHGKITKQDAKDFEEALPRILELHSLSSYSTIWIFPFSPGGDVFAALKIGELIRESLPEDSQVFIPNGNDCVSACVLIFAAGLEKRIGNGSRLGVHRPFFTEDEFLELGYESKQELYHAAHAGLEEAFRKYNVSPEVVDLMWATPSTDVYYLKEEEIERYRLVGKDLVVEETEAALLRKHCGPSAHVMKMAYEQDRQVTFDAQKRSCDKQYSLPSDCDVVECRWIENGCSESCEAAFEQRSDCSNWLRNQPYRERLLAIERKHQDYLDCRGKYNKEKKSK